MLNEVYELIIDFRTMLTGSRRTLFEPLKLQCCRYFSSENEQTPPRTLITGTFKSSVLTVIFTKSFKYLVLQKYVFESLLIVVFFSVISLKYWKAMSMINPKVVVWLTEPLATVCVPFYPYSYCYKIWIFRQFRATWFDACKTNEVSKNELLRSRVVQ